MFVAHTVLTGGEKVVDGRSAILFATVAGVSLGLLSGGAHPPGPGARAEVRRVVVVRGALLVLVGLALTALVRPPIAVILDYYGVAFLLLAAPLFLARRWLLVLAATCAVGGPVLISALTGATEFDAVPVAAQPFALWLVFGNYPVVVWLAYLLIGLVLARSDLRERTTAALALVVGTLAAVVGYGVAASVPGVDASAHSDTTAEVVASGGVAVAIIGALSLLDSATGVGERVARVVRFVLAPVAAAGAMALTLYVTQAVVLAIVRLATAHHDRWTVPDWLLPALVVGALVVAPLWRRFIGQGPLEAGLRSVSRLAGTRRPSTPPI